MHRLFLVTVLALGCAGGGIKEIAKEFDRNYIYGRLSAEQGVCLDTLPWNKRNEHLGPVPEDARVLDPAISEILREIEGR